jgi:hypothetical protein
MNVTELVDPRAVDAYLALLGREVELDDAQALAEDALEFEIAPAGAWTVLAHLAEHRGDYAGFERWTAAALDVDITFGPSVEDDAYLALLRRGAGRKVGAHRRALHLVDKLDAFCERHAQLGDVIAFAGRVIEGDPLDHPQRLLALAGNDLFLILHALEGGMLQRFLAVAGHLLPASEHAVLSSWVDVRHRFVELVRSDRRRSRFVDTVTGEALDVDVALEPGTWEPGERGFAAIVPIGARLSLIGEPMLVSPPHLADAEAAAAGEPSAVVDACLRWLHDQQVGIAVDDYRERVRFVFPDVDPDGLDWSEEGLLALVQARRPDVVEWEQLLEAIVAHRIITMRTPHTWLRAKAYLAAGASREHALSAVTYETQAEIRSRMEGEAA